MAALKVYTTAVTMAGELVMLQAVTMAGILVALKAVLRVEYQVV